MKLALFDIDGVINHAVRFSLRLSREQNIPIEIINEFFSGKFQLCLTGKLDLKIELEKIKANWKWESSVESLMNFWFEGENKLDSQILYLINKLPKHIKRIAATNQEKYRAEYLKNKMGLNAHFNKTHSSADLGIKKPDPNFFTKILEIEGYIPKDTFFGTMIRTM